MTLDLVSRLEIEDIIDLCKIIFFLYFHPVCLILHQESAGWIKAILVCIDLIFINNLIFNGNYFAQV